ncbi:DMT family transporter [Cryobacterium sp. 10C3]|uniref:DMT family transporter n=1 Tax=Cryobacterium sp. 10C3 TaxID=3048577 RepID=UPI002AB3ABD6|nr:DMT family transporter [Cryobacterium sp. 10C3]MDY7555565.1 DMT family transporter [Cryobacterium sp. 10C3]
MGDDPAHPARPGSGRVAVRRRRACARGRPRRDSRGRPARPRLRRLCHGRLRDLLRDRRPPERRVASGGVRGRGARARRPRARRVGRHRRSPLSATFGPVPLAGTALPWWVPLVIVAVVSTALAYVAGITSAEALGSRLASFVSLLEVVFAALFAWLLLGEQLTPLQLLGGALILGGIAAVRAAGSETAVPATLEPLIPVPLMADAGVVEPATAREYQG